MAASQLLILNIPGPFYPSEMMSFTQFDSRPHLFTNLS